MMIHRYRELPEALLAKSTLQSAGIECHLVDENLVDENPADKSMTDEDPVRMDWLWSNLLGGIKLYVKPEDAEAALELLATSVPKKFEIKGRIQERPHCPHCRSFDISFRELNNPIAYSSASLGIPIVQHRQGWTCHACDYNWQNAQEEAAQDRAEPDTIEPDTNEQDTNDL